MDPEKNANESPTDIKIEAPSISITDMFGEAGCNHVLERYDSNGTMFGVIFGFGITALVALIVYVSNSGLQISDYSYAYAGLILLAMMMVLSGSLLLWTVFRFDSMWPIDNDNHSIGLGHTGSFVRFIRQEIEQLSRIQLCRRLEFAEGLLISALLTSIGLICIDFVDSLLGIVIVITSGASWINSAGFGFRLLIWFLAINRGTKTH